ncbi:MAG: aldo/keto reductase [Chloroflexota bacterium]|nr:aldo/keto reductase [Chloroflexota bacterium]
MKPRKLGRSDVTVTPLGLGTGNWGREIDEDASWRVMDYAVEHGITFFDSGEVYGGGQSHAGRKRMYGTDDVRETTTEMSSSERIIGSWMRARGCRDEITLCTKVGTGNDPENIGVALAGSLDRLGVDNVDMYKLHNPDDTPIAETLAAMTEEVAAGRTRAIGCSNFSAEQLSEALDASAANGLSRFDVIQPPYSLALPDADEDIFPICEREQIAVTSYSPLGAGFLTGKYTPDRSQFPKGSRYHIVPAHADIYFSDRNFQVIGLLREQAERSGTSMVRLALAWAMRHPTVTSILVGARNSEQVDNALAALDIALDDDLWTTMRNWPA